MRRECQAVHALSHGRLSRPARRPAALQHHIPLRVRQGRPPQAAHISARERRLQPLHTSRHSARHACLASLQRELLIRRLRLRRQVQLQSIKLFVAFRSKEKFILLIRGDLFSVCCRCVKTRAKCIRSSSYRRSSCSG